MQSENQSNKQSKPWECPYNCYYKVSDSNDNIRYETVFQQDALDFISNKFKESGDLLSMEQVNL